MPSPSFLINGLDPALGSVPVAPGAAITLHLQSTVGVDMAVWSVSVTDDETRRTIKDAYASFKIVLEPHGAVAWNALNRYPPLKKGGFAVSLETADPAKFPEEIVRATGINPPLPAAMARLDELEDKFEKMDGQYASLKEYLRRFL